jgi:ribosome-binding factor A
MESTRQQKVARLLQKELAEYFRKHALELLPGKLITVTVVRVSPDLGVARVYLSIFPVKDGEEPLEKIRTHAPSIRKNVGNKIKNQVRNIPEFAYFQDDSLDYIDNIDNLLKEE